MKSEIIQSENADMENFHFLFKVNPNTVKAKYKSDEGYSWIKGYIDAIFMEEKS